MKVVCFPDHSEFLKNSVVVYKIRRGLQYLFGIFNFSSWIFKRDQWNSSGQSEKQMTSAILELSVSLKGCPSLFFFSEFYPDYIRIQYGYSQLMQKSGHFIQILSTSFFQNLTFYKSYLYSIIIKSGYRYQIENRYCLIIIFQHLQRELQCLWFLFHCFYQRHHLV